MSVNYVRIIRIPSSRVVVRKKEENILANRARVLHIISLVNPMPLNALQPS